MGSTNAAHRYRGTVLFVDDEPAFLSGLKAVLRSTAYEVLTAESAENGLEVLARQQVDVVVADERMPGESGSQFLSTVAEYYADTVRIMLTGHGSARTAIRAINECQVSLFLEKPCPPEKLKESLEFAFQIRTRNKMGSEILQVVESHLNPGCVERAPVSGMPPSRIYKEAKKLSLREREVFDLVVEGRRVSQVAKALFISPHTVRNHLKSIFQKLDVHSQKELNERFGGGSART